MKRLSISNISFFLLVLFLGSPVAIAAQGAPPTRLKIVKVKPVRPHGHFYKPMGLKVGHTWRQGHWQWNKRRHEYVWVKGHYVKRRHGKTWNSGHWSKVRGGWVYHAGFWA